MEKQIKKVEFSVEEVVKLIDEVGRNCPFSPAKEDKNSKKINKNALDKMFGQWIEAD